MAACSAERKLVRLAAQGSFATDYLFTIMSEHRTHNLIKIERIERALLLLAYFIELDGDVHLPMYDKFETELAELKRDEDTRSRAHQRLAAYKDAGTLRLIR